MPILVSLITVVEVDAAIRYMKPNKASDPDGLSPRVLRVLPAQWVILMHGDYL